MKNIELPPPANEIEIIAYQTLLPYYNPQILMDYEKVAEGYAQQIFDSLQADIKSLNSSQKKWKNAKIEQDWKEHLKNCGYNVSGNYRHEKGK
jgi:hypothetical protein